MSIDWNSILSALLGGALTFVASWYVLNKEAQEKKKREAELERRFLSSIFCEIKRVYSRYESFSKKIEESTEYLNYEMRIEEDYFPIYNNNAAYILLIKDDELRDNIISFYVHAKGLIDTIKTNAAMLHNDDSQLGCYLTALKKENDNIKKLVELILEYEE